MKPTMGRIVFFQAFVANEDDDGVRAATVNKVNRDGSVDLTVFGQDGDYERSLVGAQDRLALFVGVRYDDGCRAPGMPSGKSLHTWHWPPRV